MIVHGLHVNNEATVHTGMITDLNDTYFYVQITARMGVMKLPKRCLICEQEPEVGDKVKFLMSYVELEKDHYEREETDKL